MGIFLLYLFMIKSENEPKVLLLYPPEQRWPDMMVKPNGSLAYPALGGALREINCYVEVYDACVGNDDDDLQQFYQSTELPTGLLRTGMSDERILDVAKDFDIIGITSMCVTLGLCVLGLLGLCVGLLTGLLIIT